ncbi:hypothetical protein IJG89_00665 [Candidatus Saccharibacteria bacterium]|nr:hypothetical protein [Candidatus Saccharibacteria bacterium]
MFLNNTNEVLKIAENSGAIILVLPTDMTFEIHNAIVVQPEDKVRITIEQVRNLISRLGMKQIDDTYIIIRPADQINDEAANALLKSIEEPKDKVHFILVTDSPYRILPTILSRAPIYFLRQDIDFGSINVKDNNVKAFAKKILVAKGADLVQLADEMTKQKTKTREFVLAVLSVAIEMLYKSYFLTNREVFISKIPKFLVAYDNILKNGHIKLHLIADLC